MPARYLLIALCLSLALPARAADAESDYRDAKAALEKLKGDPKRRALRHHWQNVARKFEALAKKYGKSDRAPESLFNAGRLYNELSRISSFEEDREAAERNYRKLMTGWPKHRLADDAALSLAKLLADKKGDVAGARQVLEAALPTADDMKPLMTAMLKELPAPAPVKVTPPKAEPPVKPAPPVAKAVKEAPPPVEPKAPAEAKKVMVDPPPPSGNTDVARAILRALEPLAQQEKAREAEPPPELPIPGAKKQQAPEVVEESAPATAALAERLRDVRVGARAPAQADTETKTRLSSLAKSPEALELSLAQQLGLKVRRIVIDAGHGGHDTGAIGKGGTREKDVALAISKKLAAKLEAAGLEVVMTRTDDTFVKLEDRTKFANKQKGDLFISIHCNSAPGPKLRGIETYTLNTSSDRYAIRLSARENATTERGVGDLQYILADLATKANTGESNQLAGRVQQSLVRSLSANYKDIRNLGTKEALFFVLIGAKMPAILVETSFLSHPEEEKRLADTKYQDQVAQAISEAVTGFLEDRTKLAALD